MWVLSVRELGERYLSGLRGLRDLPAFPLFPGGIFIVDAASVIEFHGIVNANISSVQVKGGSIENFSVDLYRVFSQKHHAENTDASIDKSKQVSRLSTLFCTCIFHKNAICPM